MSHASLMAGTAKIIPVLRSYQVALVKSAAEAAGSGYQAIVVQLPTGGGKTAIFTHMAGRMANRDKACLILVHRRELLRQTSDKLIVLGIEHGIFAAGHSETNALVQIAMVQTIARRLETLPKFNFIIVDECHHAVSGQWRDLIASQPQAVVLGFTANLA